MITHIFNSSIVSGPEMLVIPALKKLGEAVSIIFLTETRLPTESARPIEYAMKFGYDVYSVPVNGRWDKTAFLELRNVLDKISPRIIHAHDVKASLYLQQAKRVRPGFKGAIVSTHHGASYRKGKIRLYEEIYVRFVLPSFDKVLCVCELDRKSVIHRGVPEGKVSIHLNGTDRPRVLPEDRNASAATIRKSWKEKMPELPDTDAAVFLGAVARLSPEKRHDRMLKVVASFKKREESGHCKKTVLLCFGEGPEEQKLRQLARTLQLEDRVFFMGYSNTISDEMAGFDALLCLSDGEGIPINLLEAGWAATPVISTRVGGIPDLINSNEAGFLVEKKASDESIAEQMWNMLQNTKQLTSVGQAYQKRVMEFFSHDAWLKKLNEVYATLPGKI
ncbi:MAG: glycosyltransferase family 4 protein [Bdellovibrionales bacterium]|nr:glycosyltransferase family 4 protein [Oligoflexia bacterium]